MIIDCIGCLHGSLPKLEGGDLIIVTGDLTSRNSHEEYIQFSEWIDKQKYRHKIFIAGNHDEKLENFYHSKYTKCDYLCDSGTEFEGLKIWGSPWSSWFTGINPKCSSFTYKDETEHFENVIRKIPLVDILVTHQPAYGILDGIPQEDGSLSHVGSKGLFKWLKYAERPKLHVFSHIHEAYGQEEYFPMMLSVNCSIMNKRYKPVNKPIRIIL